MRVIKILPQKTIECGICGANDYWVKRVKVDEVHGIFCKKCNTLNIFEDIKSKKVREAFKAEIAKLYVDIK